MYHRTVCLNIASVEGVLMARYAHVQYGELIKTLCKIQRIKGEPIPLKQVVGVIEQQLNLTVDRPRIIRALASIGRYKEVKFTYQDDKGHTVMKVTDYIVG